MKILIAIGVPRQKEAGAAGVVFNHAEELAKRGHSVECWFLEDVLKRPARPKRFEALLFARGVSKRILKERDRFDVVNLHAPCGCAYGISRALFKPAGAPPYVMTMQGSEERYVSAMRIEERKGRAWHFGWKNRLWHWLYHQKMYDYSIKTADYGAVANREGWICSELKYRREPGRIWYVPNGVEERFFITREFTEKKACELLFVGTWLDRKGVYYLADAFGLAARKNPEIRLTVAGCSVTAEKVKEIFTADVRERLNVIPFVKREDILALYEAHDIFVFPSLVEGMPLTLLEAMATGMPVVTANNSGMADVVEDEVNGLLVASADAERLAEGIERLCKSAGLREKLGLAGQETMRRYTWERVTQQMERLFLRAAQNGKD
ncbi:MAG TPA: glycosyltransferase family 4 protein [Candidatus Solibacter sp.]|nr:glycosyltransferase family 4 protein [Candidatus Solibacter sp.]